MNRKVPIWLLLFTVWLLLLITVIFGWSVRYIYEGGHLIQGKTKDVILSVAKFPTLVDQSFKQLFKPAPLVLMNRYPGINGMDPADNKYRDSNYLLLSSYNKELAYSTVKLIRLSDQQIIHSWTPDIEKIIKIRDAGKPLSIRSTKGNIVLWHPLLSPDGSLTFHTEDRSLIKIDKNAKIMWSLDGMFHHSLEFDGEGNTWASTVTRKQSPVLLRLFDDYRDDAIAKISPQGTLLYEKSITQILLDNGYRGLLFGIGPMEQDAIHLNDIQPALSSSKYWLEGDLLISIRNKSTVFLYRPSTNKVLWLQTGPWLNQHDVDFIDDTRIGIFGNDMIRNKNHELIDGHNEVYIYDFKTNSTDKPYTEFLKSANVRTITGGRSDVLPNGNLFIEETDFGRLLLGNKSKAIWQYVDRLDSKSIAFIGWSRIITADEFRTLTFVKK